MATTQTSNIPAAPGRAWTCDRKLFVLGGSVVLLSLALSFLLHSQWWLLLTAVVGINMVQYPFTGFCPGAFLLKAAGLCGKQTEKAA